MDELIKSKLFSDLKEGKLPEVQVTVSDSSLISIAFTLVIAGVVVLISKKLLVEIYGRAYSVTPSNPVIDDPVITKFVFDSPESMTIC